MAVGLLIVEDDPAVRAGLLRRLSLAPVLRVVAAVVSAETALEYLADPQVAVVLVDLRLPSMSGTELIRVAARQRPDVSCLVYSGVLTREDTREALAAGARGFIEKSAPMAELIEAIQNVAEGRARLSAGVQDLLVREHWEQARESEAVFLSETESSVLDLLASGLRRKQIAEALNVSDGTVHVHLRNIYKKLHVRGHRQALARARAMGIIKNPSAA